MNRIVEADDRNAKIVLVALCQDTDICRRAASLLDKLEQREFATSNGTKRKADSAQLLICTQCEQVFTEEENSGTACAYHEGELEIDEDMDVWVDYDEAKSGPLDSEDNRVEYPDGFFWNCCGKHGDEEEYCVQGWHIAAASQAQKRARYDDNAASASDEEDEEDEEEYSGTEDEEFDEDGVDDVPGPVAPPAVAQVEIEDDDGEGEGEEDDDEEFDSDEEKEHGA